MTDWIWVLPKFVMRHLETEAPTDSGSVHHKFFEIVNFDSDTSIFYPSPLKSLAERKPSLFIARSSVEQVNSKIKLNQSSTTPSPMNCNSIVLVVCNTNFLSMRKKICNADLP